MTSVAVVPVLAMVILTAILAIGYPIGLLLKRRILDNLKLTILAALVGGVAMSLLLYNQLFLWCYNLEHMGPLSVSCASFLPLIYATIPIGILGTLVMVYYVARKRDSE